MHYLRESGNQLFERQRGSARGPFVLVVMLAAGVAALLLALWGAGGAWTGSNRATPASPQPLPESAMAGPADYTLRPGELVKIERAELPADRLVSVDLVLVEPSRHTEPLPAQLRHVSGRALDLLAAVEVDGRMSARIAIEPGWLLPGSYLVELRTTERSHFPIRRYPLEVR